MGLYIISGYPVDDAKIGKTPAHWKYKPAISTALEEEIFLALCGALVGDLFGWSTQQDGHIIHDVFPIKGHEGEQLGTGSEQLLWWHNEDAFHPCRGDYLGLMCMRNPYNVATTFACIDMIEVRPEVAQVLFRPCFTIHPDESHMEKNKSDL